MSDKVHFFQNTCNIFEKIVVYLTLEVYNIGVISLFPTF